MGIMHQVQDTKCFSSMIAGERNWEVLSELCSDHNSKEFFSKVFTALQNFLSPILAPVNDDIERNACCFELDNNQVISAVYNVSF